MSIRYDDDHDSEWAALQAISGRLGMTAETLRKWVRQAEVDAGQASGGHHRCRTRDP
jgi:transposase